MDGASSTRVCEPDGEGSKRPRWAAAGAPSLDGVGGPDDKGAERPRRAEAAGSALSIGVGGEGIKRARRAEVLRACVAIPVVANLLHACEV